MDLDLFVKEVSKLGISVTSEKLDKLHKYYELLTTWNEKINLTSIIQENLVYLKHFYDSLTICKVINLNEVKSLCDIGTGAGFPGIVLKIFFPHIRLTLVDALLKRINFLKVVIDELSLDNVAVIHARAEEYGVHERSKFDVVTARAVASINVLLEYSMPLLKVSGYFIAMRGNDDSFGLENVCHELKCNKVKCVSLKLPVENSARSIILFRKNGETNNKYPRKNSVIKKYPL